MSAVMFSTAATHKLSVCVNQHKISKDSDGDNLYVCVEVKGVDRSCVFPRYYPMPDQYTVEDVNRALIRAQSDCIQLFIGDVHAVSKMLGENAQTYAPRPAAPNPAAPAAPAELPKPPPTVLEDDEADDEDDTPPAPAPKKAGRPKKDAAAPAAPKTRKEPKAPKEVVKYSTGDKVAANTLGLACSQIWGAEFRNDKDLFEKIKDARPRLIGTPMLIDGEIADEFKKALIDEVGSPEADDNDDF